jgi:enoyl-CoA hydratase/carnithine racemase
MAHLTYQIESGIASIVLANPPQNRIGDEMVDELAAAIDAIASILDFKGR